MLLRKKKSVSILFIRRERGFLGGRGHEIPLNDRRKKGEGIHSPLLGEKGEKKWSLRLGAPAMEGTFSPEKRGKKGK